MASAHLLFNHISTTHTDLHRCAHETYTHVYGIHIQIRTCTHRYKHIHICPPHPPYIHTQLQGRWPSLGSAGRAGPGPSVCSGWSPAGVGISGPPRVCRAGVHKCTSSPGLHLTDCGFLGGPGPRSSVPICGDGGWHAVFRAHRAAGASGIPCLKSQLTLERAVKSRALF